MAFERLKTKTDLPRYESPNHDYKDDDHFKPKGHRSPRSFFSNNIIARKYQLLPNSTRKIINRCILALLAIAALVRLLTMQPGTIEGVMLSGESLISNLVGKGQVETTVGVVEQYDLRNYGGSHNGWEKKERVLLCIPLRNAEPVIPMMISHLENLTYPHELLDLAFLVSDSSDATETDLTLLLHSSPIANSYNSISIYLKDFGQVIGQGFSDRHGFKVQGIRRKLMGRARNWLTAAALKPYHSWVYWRDADIESAPSSIIEDLMQFNRDVIVPNVWRPLPKWLGGEQPYDLNSWQESEPALEMAKKLGEDDVIVEGYAEYPTWRPHLAYFRDVNGNPKDMFDLDGIGGVSILAKAKVFRQGAMFPGFALWNHAETEGFGKLCRKMGFSVNGLPNYTIWHLYEPSEDDLKTIKKMEEEGKGEEANAPVVAPKVYYRNEKEYQEKLLKEAMKKKKEGNNEGDDIPDITEQQQQVEEQVQKQEHNEQLQEQKQLEQQEQIKQQLEPEAQKTAQANQQVGQKQAQADQQQQTQVGQQKQVQAGQQQQVDANQQAQAKQQVQAGQQQQAQVGQQQQQQAQAGQQQQQKAPVKPPQQQTQAQAKQAPAAQQQQKQQQKAPQQQTQAPVVQY